MVIDGMSNARGLHAGWRFKLAHHPETTVNREYLIIRSEFSISHAEGASTYPAGETLDTYRVTFRAIQSDVPFRLERLTPRPMIRGPQTASRGRQARRGNHHRQVWPHQGQVPLGPQRRA